MHHNALNNKFKSTTVNSVHSICNGFDNNSPISKTQEIS